MKICLCEIFVNGSRPLGTFASRSGVILDCEFDGGFEAGKWSTCSSRSRRLLPPLSGCCSSVFRCHAAVSADVSSVILREIPFGFSELWVSYLLYWQCMDLAIYFSVFFFLHFFLTVGQIWLARSFFRVIRYVNIRRKTECTAKKINFLLNIFFLFSSTHKHC